MRLSRILVSNPLKIGANVVLAPDKSHYVAKVLRLKEGQLVTLFDGQEAADYCAKIVDVSKSSVSLQVLERSGKCTDSPISITLLQAIGKNEAVDILVQKATELGVSRVVLFNAERTQFPLKDSKLEKKQTHWQGISHSACEQCDRNVTPSIELASNLRAALDTCANPATKVMLGFDEQALSKLPSDSGSNDFQLLIGPEGGLSEAEIDLARQHGFCGVTIGPRVLRMETAAISAMTLIQHKFGDM